MKEVKKEKEVETKMVETKKEKLDAILAKLQNSGEIDACAVVSREGLLLSERCPPEVDVKIFSALCASVMGASETALTQMKKGSANEVVIKGKQGQLVLIPAGPKAVLVSLVRLNANIGLVLLEMNKKSNDISKLLENM